MLRTLSPECFSYPHPNSSPRSVGSNLYITYKKKKKKMMYVCRMQRCASLGLDKAPLYTAWILVPNDQLDSKGK